MRDRTQASPLKWYTNIKYQLQNLSLGGVSLANGTYVDPVPVNQIPPFQFPRNKTGNEIIWFRIHNCETGVVDDITAEIKESGLSLRQYTNYDMIVYPASVKFVGINVGAGTYYATMSDGVTTWYSETFTMDLKIEHKVEIEYCNKSSIFYPNGGSPTGEMDYSSGYRNRIYLDTQIGQPRYPNSNEVVERQARRYPKQRVSYKEYTMLAQVPEHVIDTLRLVWLHDEITIRENGRTYEVVDFDIPNDPEWKGPLAQIEIVFITDVYVTKVASGSEDSCTITPGSCIATQRTVKDLLVKGSDQYNDHEYTDSNGATQDLEDGDYILSNNALSGGVTTIEQFDGSSYVAVVSFIGSVVYNESNGAYYFYPSISEGYILPQITDYTAGTLTGKSLPGVINEIWSRSTTGEDIFVAAYPTPDIESGVAISPPSNSQFLFLRVGSVLCGSFYDSVLFSIEAPSVGCDIVIKGTFESPFEAAAAGLVADDYYILSADNVFGWPWGLVMQFAPTTTYASDSAATSGGVSDDDCYSMANLNLYDMSENAVKVLNPSTTYTGNADAGSNGVDFDGQYALSNGNDYSVPFEGFLMIRKF